MNTSKNHSRLTLAAAAAALFALAPVAASAGEDAAVQCMGVNACQGKSACKTANSSCKGHNACKGQGFVMVSEEVCGQLGGEFG